MALTKFKLGQRVIITVSPEGCADFKGSIGTVTRVSSYYRVLFDIPLHGYTDALCEEHELSLYEPTDIMEYLKDKLLGAA